MKPTANNVITKLLPVVEAKSGGIILPTKPEKKYEVISCGPKVQHVNPGDVIKPFKYCEGRHFEYEGGKFYIFNTDEFDDIVV